MTVKANRQPSGTGEGLCSAIWITNDWKLFKRAKRLACATNHARKLDQHLDGSPDTAPQRLLGGIALPHAFHDDGGQVGLLVRVWGCLSEGRTQGPPRWHGQNFEARA